MDNKKLFTARLIRVLTVPPVMALALMLCLYGGGIVPDRAQALGAVLSLGLVPVLAYPISAAVPGLRRRGREGQRNTAFIMSLLGYAGGWLMGTLQGLGPGMMFIYGTYLFSVLILLVFNKLFKLRASGHACSVTGPALLIICFLRGWWPLPCLAVYGLSFWASLASRRHSAGEYILGSLSCVLAMGLALLLY